MQQDSTPGADSSEARGAGASAPGAGSPQDTAAFNFVRQLASELSRGELNLPPFPDTALRVQECVNDPNSDIQALTAIVATEPALAARLMRMANSVLMRRGPLEVTDLQTAISRVGMKMVQNAAVAYASQEAFHPPPGSASLDELEQLRRESVQIAAITYVLARRIDAIKKPEEAMLAGLLHAVGRFYIIMCAADHPALFTDRDTLHTLVQQWHAGVARAIIEAWEFPASIAVAIGEWEVAERDRQEDADLGDLLYVANLLVREGRAPESLDDHEALRRMHLDGETLAQILAENDEAIHSMVDAMGR